MFRLLFALLFTLFLYQSGFTQQRYKDPSWIEGTVQDEDTGEPLIGVNVLIEGTTQGASTDINGRFYIPKPPLGYIRLNLSYIGYEPLLTEQYFITNTTRLSLSFSLIEKALDLQEVTVVTSAFQKKVEAPLSVQKISVGEIERTPGGNRDISRIVQVLPGVLSSPAFRNDLIVRGGGPDENGFYLEGIEIPTLNHFATQGASGGVVSVINVDFIKEVTLLTGAIPVEFGGALSSILNFDLTRGNKSEMKYRATVGATDMGFSMNGPLSSKTTFVGSIRRSYLQLLFSALQLPFLPTYNDVQFKTTTQIGDNGYLSLFLIGGYDDNQLNLDIEDPTEDQRYILGYLPENRQFFYTLGASYNFFKGGARHRITLSRSSLTNHLEKYEDNDENQDLLTYVKGYEGTNQAGYKYSRRLNPIFRIVAGAEVGQTTYTNRTQREEFRNDAPLYIDYNALLNLWHWGAYSQLQGRFFNKLLEVTLGVRSDWNSYNSATRDFIRNLSPRVTANYPLGDKWQISGAVGRYIQLPPLTAMGYKEELSYINKETLKPISLVQSSIGTTFSPSKELSLSVEGFYKRYYDTPVSTVDSVALANKGADFVGIVGDEPLLSVGDGKSYGVELLLRTTPIKDMTLLVSYTHSYSKFKSNLGTFNRYISANWDNRNLASIIISQRLKGDWNIGAKWRYIGKSPYTPFDADRSSLIEAWESRFQPYLNYSAYNTLRLPSFHQLDIRVEKGFYFSKWSIIGYVDIQNIYNRKAIGPPLLVPERDMNEQPIVDPNDQTRYLMQEIKNEVGGTILPTVGIIVDF